MIYLIYTRNYSPEQHRLILLTGPLHIQVIARVFFFLRLWQIASTRTYCLWQASFQNLSFTRANMGVAPKEQRLSSLCLHLKICIYNYTYSYKPRLEIICKYLFYSYFVHFCIYFILRYNIMLRKHLFVSLRTLTF